MSLSPSEGHRLSTLDKSMMYEGTIYLGKYDSLDNYIEVTEEEYQEWKKKQDEKDNENII